MTLDEVIERHTKAAGGRRAIEAVHGLEIDFHLSEATFEADGVYRAERLGRMRVDVFMDGVRVFSEGFDGRQAWQLPRGEEHGSPGSPAGARALLRGIEHQLYGLHELGSRGHQLDLEGRESMEELDYWVIRIVHDDGQMLWRYVNATTWRIERGREHKALHPDVDPTETTVETRFSDFRDAGGGLLRPFHETQVDLSSGRQLQATSVRQIQINPEFAPGLFDLP